MKKQIKCLRCGCQKLYSVRTEKVRCSSCGYEWKPDKLPLYLAEYVWKYNHRNDSIDLQKKLILKQLERCHV